MGSKISDILSSYKKSLDESQSRYEGMMEGRMQSTEEFYNEFLLNLIKEYPNLKNNPNRRSVLKNKIQTFFGEDEIKFAAVDGTSYKQESQDYMVFFGASYAVRGSIKFTDDPPSTTYERWSPEQDVSMVAYVPIPFAHLGDLVEEQFVINSDNETINLMSIHNSLMQLSEIYLIFDLVSASSLRPKIVLWDQSMSGVLASTDIGTTKIGIVGTRFRGREIGYTDLIIAYSHPYNEQLNVPSTKDYRFYNRVLMELFKTKKIKISQLAINLHVTREKLLDELDTPMVKNNLIVRANNKDALINLDLSNDLIEINQQSQFVDSWDYMRGYFENTCKRLFKDKDVTALTYSKGSGNERIETWMTPNDLKFLVALGIRIVTEECWKNKVMLVGIVKDSASKYLIRNYLGVMKEYKHYSFTEKQLLWTDRTVLEALPVIDEKLTAPWSTIEFDSVFMTLAMRMNEEHPVPSLQGVQGNVVNTERLFLRSLAQFFLSREKITPLMGHVIFVDRLAFPSLDSNTSQIILKERQIGVVEPIVYLGDSSKNDGQEIMMYLLEILTRNLYPDVIGYPDPLHKADWGAKSVERKVKYMISSSDTSMRRKPLVKTLREIREKYRRI
ncbi:MAG: hypothetical protein ACYDAO_05200 [Thermoplasmataceae archaeon]